MIVVLPCLLALPHQKSAKGLINHVILYADPGRIPTHRPITEFFLSPSFSSQPPALDLELKYHQSLQLAVKRLPVKESRKWSDNSNITRRSKSLDRGQIGHCSQLSSSSASNLRSIMNPGLTIFITDFSRKPTSTPTSQTRATVLVKSSADTELRMSNIIRTMHFADRCANWHTSSHRWSPRTLHGGSWSRLC